MARAAAASTSFRIGIDTGGTFTDLVVEGLDGGIRFFKGPTTPEDPIRGLVAVICAAASELELAAPELLGRTSMIVYGTTRATNAIVEGKIEKRRDEFIIRIKLRAGKSGELIGDSIDTKAEGPRIDGRAQKDLKDELVGKIDELESNHDGAGGDDADDDPPARRAARAAKDDDEDKPARKPARAEKDDDGGRQAREMRLEIEDWADGILSTLEVNLDKFLAAVRRGRERLHERSQETVVAGIGPEQVEEESYT